MTTATPSEVLASAIPPKRTGTSSIPFALYAMTGFTGLLAEQGFEKYIALLVGATASASAVVLFTYFLGFALGGVGAAWFLKRRRVSRPLLAYGVLELFVGIACIAFAYSFHGLMEWMAPLQNLASSAGMKLQVRFLSGCLLVLPAAALMGASFPLIAQAIDSGDVDGRKRWSQAYTANLVGALAAAVFAPLVVMPILGLRGAMWLCFAITAAVCAVTAKLPHQRIERLNSDLQMRTPAAKGIRLLLAASFASGLVFFALEVIWTHLIGVVIGCSIYAFSWMLAAVLSGLLIGALMANRGAGAAKPIRTSLLFQGAAMLLLVQFRFWDRVPVFFSFTPPAAFQNSFYFAETFKLLVAMLLLVPVSAVLGLIYPRLLASPQLEGRENSYLAGYMSAVNALGCLFGALLGTFVLVPVLGSELSLKATVFLLAGLWILFLRQESVSRPQMIRATVMAVLLFGLAATWRWDWGTLTAGTGNFFGQARVTGKARAAVTDVKYLPASMIFRHEDIQGGITTVVEQTVISKDVPHTVRTMYTNGKFQGDDNAAWGEGQAQFGFSAIPTLFVERYDRALLIGLGTGHSATALKHLGFREIEVAEFAAGIVEAARQKYQKLNEGILEDRAIRMHLEDGRNVLLTDAQKRYDLITIEISSIWFAGSTNLYSREFYELARKRLTEDGVLQQWVQLHHVSPAEIASELATVRAVFPYAALWFYGNQGMLVAANKPLMLSAERRETIARSFQASTGLSAEASQKLVGSLEESQLLDQGGVSRMIAATNPVINTDHNRWIEYATPRYQSSSFDWMSYNRKFLAQFR